jgi:Xaa-Pro aminopeptidase
MQILEVQDQLLRMNIDGWLLYDFQGINPIARKLVGLQGQFLTRRWYYWVPKRGTPTILCHRIEQHGFSSLQGQTRPFRSWEEMLKGLREMLEGYDTIAMEYSPNCSIPYVSRVDAGTVEIVKGFGKNVVSSANLVQYFEARWSQEQLQTHREASRLLMDILFRSFQEAKNAIKNRVPISEFTLQQFMLEKYQQLSLFAFSPPIVAVNQNSGNPHYEPRQDDCLPVQSGDLLLIDLWAKLQKPGSVYADYTWVAYIGNEIPESYLKTWEIVKGARDAALDFLKKNYPKEVRMEGWEVDAVARNFISQAGYGDFFIHRTGHNIGEEDHGNGANMDSLETRDERLLIPHTCFSIEPGIYFSEFGIRSEINVYLDDSDIIVTGEPIQNEIVRIV